MSTRSKSKIRRERSLSRHRDREIRRRKYLEISSPESIVPSDKKTVADADSLKPPQSSSLGSTMPKKFHAIFDFFIGDINRLLMISGIIHVILILYSEYHDEHNRVKYTDIDYSVFTDAARHVAAGGSPYERHTYRYTPLLAWFMVPNIFVHHSFGKYLFSVFDLIAGYMLYRLTGRSSRLASLWLLSPITLAVSSRGSCDSIICCAIISLVFLAEERMWGKAAVLFGFAVHFRLFPIVLGLPLAIRLWSQGNGKKFLARLYPLVRFGLISVIVFLGLLGFFYKIYGYEFVYETYLYHFIRKDHRHNFSLFFYPIYLVTSTNHPFGKYVGLVTFLPQMVSLVVIGLMKRPLPVIALLQTLAFVTFNKVITAQYFTWFLCLLPLVVPHMEKGSLKWLGGLLGFWLAAELFWVSRDFKLEKLGQNDFLGVFVACCVFFVANISLIVFIIKATAGRKLKP